MYRISTRLFFKKKNKSVRNESSLKTLRWAIKDRNHDIKKKKKKKKEMDGLVKKTKITVELT